MSFFQRLLFRVVESRWFERFAEWANGERRPKPPA